MALVKVKPTSPGRRALVKVVIPNLHKGKPVAALIEKQSKRAGRNNSGHITTRHKGGGHKQHYRIVDFVRDKDGIVAKVERIEYDPNRSANLALLCYADGERRYVIAPKGAVVGQEIINGSEAPIKSGNTLPLRNIPVGTTIHCIEMQPGKGAQLARAAGTSVQLLAREGVYAQLRLRSGEIRKVHVDCRATIGEVGNEEHNLESIGKAGASALARHAPDGARRCHEPDRPSARWRRRQDRSRSRSGESMGHSNEGLQDPPQQAYAQHDCAKSPRQIEGRDIWHVRSRRARSSITIWCRKWRRRVRPKTSARSRPGRAVPPFFPISSD